MNKEDEKNPHSWSSSAPQVHIHLLQAISAILQGKFFGLIPVLVPFEVTCISFEVVVTLMSLPQMICMLPQMGPKWGTGPKNFPFFECYKSFHILKNCIPLLCVGNKSMDHTFRFAFVLRDVKYFVQ